MREIYGLAKVFLLSQRGFCCIELAIYMYVRHVTGLSRKYPNVNRVLEALRVLRGLMKK